MDIIYTQSALDYKGNERPEGKYRLEGIGEIGRKIAPQEVSGDLPRLIHPEDYLRHVKNAGEAHRFLAEVPTDKETYGAALRSADLAVRAAKRHHFACTRPPGHHATRSVAKGFCFFNNMAIAVQALLESSERTCILDIDGHQGDGTEEIFYGSNRVLFFSIHQEFVYPHISMMMGPDSDYDLTVEHRGSKEGEGFTFNIPLPANSGDDILLDTLHHFTAHIQDFNPDLIGISAGFDGYKHDALLNLNYSQAGYYTYGQRLREFDIPVFGILEGGYHSDVVNCINALVAGVNGQADPTDQEKTTSPEHPWSRYREYLNRF